VARRSSSICLPLTIRKQDLDARNYHNQVSSHRIECADVCKFG
jgi:sulfur transfer complex TusBCD TusB component (DsrH family)